MPNKPKRPINTENLPQPPKNSPSGGSSGSNDSTADPTALRHLIKSENNPAQTNQPPLTMGEKSRPISASHDATIKASASTKEASNTSFAKNEGTKKGAEYLLSQQGSNQSNTSNKIAEKGGKQPLGSMLSTEQSSSFAKATSSGGGAGAGASVGFGGINPVSVIAWTFLGITAIIAITIILTYFAGYEGTTYKQASPTANQITPATIPCGNIPNLPTLEDSSSWSQFQKNDKGSQATSVAMALTYLGYPTTETEIISLGGEDTNIGSILGTFNNVVSTGNQQTNNFDQLKDFIKKYIDKGIPVIIGVGQPIAPDQNQAHFIVVIGYNQNGIAANDPHPGSSGSYSWDEIKKSSLKIGNQSGQYIHYALYLKNQG